MVKITFKTVQNKLFTVEAEGSETVADLKSKIQETQTFPVENQKLIYSGKILQDAATVSSLNIKEKDFLVVMVSKPKAAPAAAAASAPTPAPAPAPAAAESTPAAPSASAESTEQPQTAPSPEAGQSGSAMGSSFLAGPALQQAIAGIEEMGFPRSDVMAAMKASFNNPDRAVEYLMNGHIPNVEGQGASGNQQGPTEPQRPIPTPQAPAATPAAATPSQPAQAAPAAPAPVAPAPGGSAENLFAAAEAAMNRDRGVPAQIPGRVPTQDPSLTPRTGGADATGLGAIANSPQIQRLREAVQQNPALLQPLLQQIAGQNPRLAQLMNDHPQELLTLLGDMGQGDADEEQDDGPMVMQVDLTQDEAAAVERLEQLGFDRQIVLQAYMLCDKNEELAANFLFDNGEDD